MRGGMIAETCCNCECTDTKSYALNDLFLASLIHGDVNLVLRQMENTLRNHTSQFEKVLQAIVETRTTLESKIGAVVADVGLLRADQRVLADRVSEMQKDLGGLALQEKETITSLPRNTLIMEDGTYIAGFWGRVCLG
ncbi:hypothetical protein NDU88_006476 [Pleurodeles waltl]|uniref:Uncharacterized protein n=1 Tax=Pleurodeles waltl TaxID=8319 RepID=A0AAV7NQA9_PLEWA|nr:hypothetical protein NDU88_006476 [Pleurodeles waltl]